MKRGTGLHYTMSVMLFHTHAEKINLITCATIAHLHYALTAHGRDMVHYKRHKLTENVNRTMGAVDERSETRRNCMATVFEACPKWPHNETRTANLVEPTPEPQCDISETPLKRTISRMRQSKRSRDRHSMDLKDHKRQISTQEQYNRNLS